MKKIFIALVLFCVAAGAFAQDFRISAGGVVQYNLQRYGFGGENAGVAGSADASWSFLTIGAFADFTYAVVDLSYGFSLGGPSGTVYVGNTVDDGGTDWLNAMIDGYGAGYLIIKALGKYPFDLGGVVIFPAVGLEYRINLSFTDDGDDVKATMSNTQKAALNDFLILAGAGADFTLAENLYIRVLILFAYNLNPDTPGSEDQEAMADPGTYSEWSWDLRGSVGLGYKF